MYLGTESSTHARRQKLENMKRSKEKREKHALPGSAFFYQASELFTGLLLRVLLIISPKMVVSKSCFYMHFICKWLIVQ